MPREGVGGVMKRGLGLLLMIVGIALLLFGAGAWVGSHLPDTTGCPSNAAILLFSTGSLVEFVGLYGLLR
jgi:hypothetical protein